MLLNISELYYNIFLKKHRGVIFLVGFRFSSRTKILKIIGSNQFSSTRKTPKIKKCPISRTNIVNFDTLTLYQDGRGGRN